MLRKINKKVIVAVFIAAVMTVSLVSTASASGMGLGSIGPCSHGYEGLFAYAWHSGDFQAAAVIENHSGCTGARLSATITLSNGSTISQSINGYLDAYDTYWVEYYYTPASGVTIRSVSITFRTCNASRTI